MSGLSDESGAWPADADKVVASNMQKDRW